MLGSRADPTTLRALQHELGTDRSVPEQLKVTVTRLAQGDLGTSLTQSGRSVAGIMTARTGVTLQLVGVALVFSVLFGLTLGLMSGMSTRLALLGTVRGAVLVGLALPTFVVGLVLLLCSVSS